MSATVPQTELVTVTIDGIDVQVPKGTLLVEAAKSIHRDIPVYCYHEKLGPAGLCRVCLVEIEGMPKLQIACNTVVADGMKVHTTNPKVDDGRRAILEFFLLNHPLDCPICDKGGECDLQDYSMAYGQGSSRMVEPKYAKPKAVDLGPTIVLDEERCIVCQRCVRFDDVITQENSLRTDDRGAHTLIATATGKPYVSDFTGNVTELCPVGALTSKTYRFRSRPWDNHRTTTSCTQCAVGCQMHVDERGNTVLRTMSVTEDDAISDAWLCDRGRYNIGFVADERRITQPLLRVDGAWNQVGYDDATALWAQKLKAALAAGGPLERRRARRRAAAQRGDRAGRARSPGARDREPRRAGRRAARRPPRRLRLARRARERRRRSSPWAGRPRSSRRCSTCASARPSRATARGCSRSATTRPTASSPRRTSPTAPRCARRSRRTPSASRSCGTASRARTTRRSTPSSRS